MDRREGKPGVTLHSVHMSILKICLFGESLHASDRGGNELALPSRHVEALLITLALKTGGDDLETLAELIFGDRHATESVRLLVAELRSALRTADVIVDRGDFILLDADEVEIDARQFDELLAAPSINAVRRAADVYRGNLLEHFVSGIPAFDAWLADRRVMYWRAALIILGNLLTTQVRAGWWEEAVATAGHLLSLDPSQEVVHRTLIRLQLEQGRPDSALRRYEECADLLRREYRREPSAETERLHDEIVRVLERNPAPRESVLRPNAGPKLVLVVEDDLVSAALVESYLRESDFEVIVVGDGGEALIELGKRRFDLIILDINIPTLSGLKVFEIMLQKQLDTPALFVTGVQGTEVEMQSLEMGAAGFLRKPIRKEVLLPKIRGILQRSQRNSASSR